MHVRCRHHRLLGHHVTATGIEPLPDRVDAINRPMDKKRRQAFLGMLNFYHRFVPNAANLLHPLHNALKCVGKSLTWTEAMTNAFPAAKTALAVATLLVHPKHADRQILPSAIGASLEQYIHGNWQPLVFFSRTLIPAEARNSAFGRERLATYQAVRHFRYFLEGRIFHIYTDHKPLTFAFSSIVSLRQTRYLSFIVEFTTDVRHMSGKDKVGADALSRVRFEDDSPSPIAVTAQAEEPNVQAYRSAVAGLVLRDVELATTHF